MMKKMLAIGLVGLVSMSLLAGCSNDKEKTASGDSSSGTVKGLRMSWWGDDNRHEATLNAIGKYEESAEGVEVKSEYNGYNAYQEKITTQLAGNTEPDVMQINYDWYPTFSKTGTGFYDLYTLKDILDLTQFDSEFLKFGEIDGKLNGIPYGKNTMTLAVNKTVYDKLGLEVPKTWEDFEAAAEKFPEGSFPVLPTNPMFMLNIYLQQLTGLPLLSETDELNYSEADFTKALEWYKGMVDQGVFVSRQDYLDNVGSDYTSVAQNQKYLDGQYAAIIDWSGALDSYGTTLAEVGSELVVVDMPQIAGSKVEGTISKPTMFFSISKNTKSPKQAAQLLNFLLNEETGIQELGLSRGVPASATAVATLDSQGILDGIAKDAYEYGNSVESLAERPLTENQTIQTAYVQELEKYELGQSDLKTAAKVLYETIENFLATTK